MPRCRTSIPERRFLKEDEVQAFADAVADRFGGADMLINNAGQGYVAHFADTPREAWLHEAELKLFGVINPVKAFQAQLERSDIASITCVNSLLALQPEEHMIATSAARAALLNMTLTLSKELISKGIRVNSILLGMVESGQWQRRFENRADKRQSCRRSLRRRCCLWPRRWYRLPPAPRWMSPAVFAVTCKEPS
jgi:NAD(P)-dependent dehydrogenase (short-subunit alcohol dehydrogenase family)